MLHVVLYCSSAPTSSNSNGRGNASVSMVHSVPELTVSLEVSDLEW